MAQATSYQNVKNGKYAVKKTEGYGTPVKLEYLKSIPLTPQVGETAVYANGKKIETAVSDTGFTGSIGTTAPDRALEASFGQSLEGASGLLDANLTSYTKGAFYYEFDEQTEAGVSYTVKVWMLNVEVGKSSVNHETNKDTPTIGDYAYPIAVLGDRVKADGEGNDYVDENGNTRTAFRVVSLPTDPGYDTFGDTVPMPVVKSSAA